MVNISTDTQLTQAAATMLKNENISQKRRRAALIRWGKLPKVNVDHQGISGSHDPSSPLEKQLALSLTATKKQAKKEILNSNSNAALKKDMRRQAALLGWQTRRMLAKKSEETSFNSKSNNSLDESDDKRQKSSEITLYKKSKHDEAFHDDFKRPNSEKYGKVQKEPPNGQIMSNKNTSTKSTTPYNKEMRRRAALIGWQKRRGTAASRKQYVSSSPESPPLAQNSPPLLHPSSRYRKEEVKETNSVNFIDNGDRERRVSKRSRRNSHGSQSKSDEDRKSRVDIIATATYLRVSRRWMEFHPSSRYGNGTATYGYIPASIASFIRNGTLSQRAVMECGKLGVHYALDYEGFGGLREMIKKFGEDYSPSPTEEMMESSEELNKKKRQRVANWDLGDDLPWRELEKTEKKTVKGKSRKNLDNELREIPIKSHDHSCNRFSIGCDESPKHIFKKPTETKDGFDDLSFVASILASLRNCAREKLDLEQSSFSRIICVEDNILTKECKSHELMEDESIFNDYGVVFSAHRSSDSIGIERISEFKTASEGTESKTIVFKDEPIDRGICNHGGTGTLSITDELNRDTENQIISNAIVEKSDSLEQSRDQNTPDQSGSLLEVICVHTNTTNENSGFDLRNAYTSGDNVSIQVETPLNLSKKSNEHIGEDSFLAVIQAKQDESKEQEPMKDQQSQSALAISRNRMNFHADMENDDAKRSNESKPKAN